MYLRNYDQWKLASPPRLDADDEQTPAEAQPEATDDEQPTSHGDDDEQAQ